MSDPAPIGDLVRVFSSLGIAHDGVMRIEALRALGWLSPQRSTRTGTETHPITAADQAPRTPRRPAKNVVRSELHQLVAGPEPNLTRRPELGPLPLPRARDYQPLFTKPIDPLLNPQFARAIVGRLAAMLRGELDLVLLVSRLSRLQPAVTLPRRRLLTLAAGVQLLLDVSPAMIPFMDDILALIRQLRQTVGGERLEIRKFEYCPSFGIVDEKTSRLTPYNSPQPGTAVLAVTDLGVLRADRSDQLIRANEWLNFSRALAAGRTPVTVLTPYPERRLGGRSFTRRLRLVLWDRITRVRHVPAPILVGGAGE
jgi:hypothetical protein